MTPADWQTSPPRPTEMQIRQLSAESQSALEAGYNHLYKMSRLILRALLMERFKRNPTDSEMDTHWQMYAREVEAKR